jgi:hypothetical protein
MGIFVNRLAARALGAMPCAEPRIPAQFTPDNPRTGQVRLEGAHEIASELRFSRLDTASRSKATTATAPELTARDSDAWVSSQLHTSSQQLGEAPRFFNAVSRGTSERLFVHPQALRGAQHPPEDPQPKQSNQPADTARMSDFAAVHNRQQTEPPLEQVSPAAYLGSVSRLQPAPEAGRSDQRQTEAQRMMQNPPAPSIRVSIGRVEIRAEIASPPASTTSRPKLSTVSLDQFLSQRNAGRR